MGGESQMGKIVVMISHVLVQFLVVSSTAFLAIFLKSRKCLPFLFFLALADPIAQMDQFLFPGW